MAKEEHQQDVQSENMRIFLEAYAIGAREFAGHVVMQIDRAMEGISLRDQEILYLLRTKISEEISRRYPNFDLESESRSHAVST